MASFYQLMRRKLNILIDQNGKPTGGKWSFDEDNRKKIPQKLIPPLIPKNSMNTNLDKLKILMAANYLKHKHYEKLSLCCPYIENNTEPTSIYLQVL